MSRRLLISGLLALLVFAAPLAAAQAAAPPEGATESTSDLLRVAHWVGNQTAVAQELEAGRSGNLWIAIAPLENRTQAPPADDSASGDNGTADPDTNTTDNATAEGSQNVTAAWVAVVTFGAGDLNFSTSNLTLLVPEAPDAWATGFADFSTAGLAAGAATYTFTVTLHEGDADGPVLDTFTGTGTVTIEDALVPQPPAPGLPTGLLVGLLALLVVGGGATAYALKQRRDRQAIQRAPRRSQALREEQLERQVTTAKRPEQAEQIKQEIRQQERVRETRRELQILEAKRADALKTLDLLKKRHEAGGLTKLQYDTMAAKKQADLERIEREIAEMRAEDDGPGAAA